jgi:microcystin-dependent protein
MADIGLVPVGSILPYAGERIADQLHWRLCDGSTLKNTEYSELFGILGTRWGGNGADLFCLPDLRGRFIRGVDRGTNRDPDVAARTVPQPALHDQGNQGDAVGSLQGDQLRSHSHTGAIVPAEHSHRYREPQGGGSSGVPGNPQGLDFTDTSSVHLDVQINPTGGSETRPTNVNVNFIIRVA